MNDDRYYHAARAAEERRIAMASAVLKARAVHLELAERYDALVDGRRPAQVPSADELRKAG